jgi:hypothetical protein
VKAWSFKPGVFPQTVPWLSKTRSFAQAVEPWSFKTRSFSANCAVAVQNREFPASCAVVVQNQEFRASCGAVVFQNQEFFRKLCRGCPMLWLIGVLRFRVGVLPCCYRARRTARRTLSVATP